MDPISLQAIRGTKILLKSTPPLWYVAQAKLDRGRVDPVLGKAIQNVLQLKAIQVVSRDTKVFLSSVFTVPLHNDGCLQGPDIKQLGSEDRLPEQYVSIL